MKINTNDAIVTPNVLLVPYSRHHVPTYHVWMQNPELQQLTASEPLTLEQEYEMQASWRNDADKLTFIVCASPLGPQLEAIGGKITPEEQDSPEQMIGDVNLFLYDDEEEDEDVEKDENKKRAVIGELEIMIARTDSRGKGLARETLVGFMWYITESLSAILSEYANGQVESNYLKYLRVKIDKDNARSLALFERAGFTRTSAEPNYFGEVEMRSRVVDGRLVDVESKIGLGGELRKVAYR